MALIEITNLSFTHEGSYDPVFTNLNLQLDTDWRLGFIGRNGRGKTTLLQLLMGKGEYSGHIATPVAFDSFPFTVSDSTQSVEHVAEQLRPEVEEWRLIREMNRLALNEELLSRPFQTLSKGEQTRFLLALLFLREAHFLLIDEPTNHLDAEGRALVGAYLAKKRGFILVSHDRTVLDCSVDHVLVFQRTGLMVQKGNFTSWWQNKEYHEQFELAEQEKLRKDIKRLEHAAKRTAAWSDATEQSKYGTCSSGLRTDRGYVGHKAAKLMKRAKAVDQRKIGAIEEKSKLLKNVETAEPLKLHPLAPTQNKLIEFSELILYYDGQPICRPLSMELQCGQRIALEGANGAGKSSILKLLMGEKIAYTGIVHIASGLVVSYLPQDTSFLQGDLTQFARTNHIEEDRFKTILRKLDFARVQFEKDMGQYSDGQKKKVLIARSLCQQAHIYLWDEPLNFVDVYSRVQLQELLLTYIPTMIFVEHDGAFTEQVATNKVNLSL